MVEDWRNELEVDQTQSRYMGNKAWWCYGLGSGGRLFILGPYSSEDECDRDACKRFTEDFEILGLSTSTGKPMIDKERVTQIIKKRRMDEANLSLEDATRYARHYSKEQ